MSLFGAIIQGSNIGPNLGVRFEGRHTSNVFSQNGEDGIIEEILNRLEIQTGWVCEFGAWDGIYLSNTFNLIKIKDF